MRRWLAGLLLLIALGGAQALAPAPSLIPLEQQRSAEQTFLTFPEWFLVHSPAEYARFTRRNAPHNFPFIGHIRQLWTGYANVAWIQWQRGLPPNPGYHVMIGVIATSTTVEYGLRFIYENTFGRLSAASAGGELSEEDQYGARVAQNYVDFIRQKPWYLYDFSAKLRGLWQDVPLGGPHLLRKWERRYALSTEYLVKAAYAKIIEVATRASYDPAGDTTQVIATAEPQVPVPKVAVLGPTADGRVRMELPRYDDFRRAATVLARQGVELADIAGNQGDIMVTVIGPDGLDGGWLHKPQRGTILFTQRILTEPGKRRYAVAIPVLQLSRFLGDAMFDGIEVEHVYDY